MANSPFEYLYGINSVAELIAHGHRRVEEIYIDTSRRDKRIAQLLDRAQSAKLSVSQYDKAEFARLLQVAGLDAGVNHQGVMARCRPREKHDEAYLDALLRNSQEPLLFLILDGVTDPHNLGACMRSANAAGADAVIIPKDKSVGLTPVVRKVASGAAEVTPLVVVKNLARCIKALQQAGIWVMGAAGEANSRLFDLALQDNIAIVMGSEGAGLRRLTRERCDELFVIPMAGTVESLNVSVAAGICLFEVTRQRLDKTTRQD